MIHHDLRHTGQSISPKNVSAAAGDQQVTISWDSVLGATSYTIYWSTSTGVSTAYYGGKIEDITETSYTFTNLINGTTYYYVVTAENTFWESGESSEVSAKPVDSGADYPDTRLDSISVGNGPRGVAVTPNGSYVYVANWGADTVSVIQTADNTLLDSISVGHEPWGVAVTPNGSYVYVANWGADTVSVIRTSDNTVVDSISVGVNPYGVAVTPNGSYVYVANRGDDTVSVIRTSDNTVVDSISVDNYPESVAVTPNGSYVYVAHPPIDTVSVIQTSDNTVVDSISVDNYPGGIAATPNGSYVYVANGSSNTVSVIRTSDNTVVDSIYVGAASSHDVAVTPNGSYVYVTLYNDDTVSVIGFSTEPEIAPPIPTNVAATPGDGQVTISWNTAVDATSYNIYWSTSSGVSKDTYEGEISTITSTSYTHTGLTNFTTYYYVLTAENSYGESDESEEVSATPPWTDIESISASGQYPSIAIGPYYEVHIVWTDNGQVYYRTSSDGGYP